MFIRKLTLFHIQSWNCHKYCLYNSLRVTTLWDVRNLEEPLRVAIQNQVRVVFLVEACNDIVE